MDQSEGSAIHSTLRVVSLVKQMIGSKLSIRQSRAKCSIYRLEKKSELIASSIPGLACFLTSFDESHYDRIYFSVLIVNASVYYAIMIFNNPD